MWIKFYLRVYGVWNKNYFEENKCRINKCVLIKINYWEDIVFRYIC